MSRSEISADAVDRIVRSVRLTTVPRSRKGRPPNPNTDLHFRLHRSLEMYRKAGRLHSDADKKLQIRELSAICKTASKLSGLLAPKRDWDSLSFEIEVVQHGLENLVSRVEWEIRELEMKVMFGDDWTRSVRATEERDLIRTRSPFEWLVGTYLAEDFRVCFGKEPGFSRAPDGALGGPFIRFVASVLAEFDVKKGKRPYSLESIAKVLQKGRPRRQPKRQLEK